MLKHSSRLILLYFIATLLLGISFSSQGQANNTNNNTDFLVPILSFLLEEEIAPTAPTTLTFDEPADSISFTVPNGINFLQVEAYGAQGGRGRISFINGGAFSPEGGLGGRSEDIIPVTPGQLLTIVVGGQGGDASGSFGGGGGGGYSGILSFDFPFPLILAGGGGGAAAGNQPSEPGVGGGASGGNAIGFEGFNFFQGQGGANGQGGAAGSGTAGNLGSDGGLFDFGDEVEFGLGGRGGGNGGNGGAGGLGFGGEGGLAGGGGGGGYGGGGGGSLNNSPGGNNNNGAGGGGGGFASFNSEISSGFPDGTTESGVNAGDGKVIINLFSQRPPQTIVEVFDTPSSSFEYNLPSDVSEFNVVVLGARGGTGGDSVAGGLGGQTEATASLSPDQSRRLIITVGGRGGNGVNGGGGGGGGKSSVAFDYDSPFIIAGGGGGGAGGRFDARTDLNGLISPSNYNEGNQGGNGTQNGQNGLANASQAAGQPPATGGLGGGGNVNGTNSTNTNIGNSVGGAGGIGGGGNGGAGVLSRFDSGNFSIATGGGGGGGGGGMNPGRGGTGGTFDSSFSGTGGGGGSGRTIVGGSSSLEGNTESDDGMVILTYTIN